MKSLVENICNAVTQVAGPAEEMVLLHRPFLPPEAWDYTRRCLDTGWVSSAGSYVTEFEEQLAELVGCTRAVATVNGTAALEMCLRLSGVQSGDEVLCPSLSFVATANAVAHCGATPHFVEVEETRMGVCPERLSDYLSKVLVAGEQGPVNRVSGRPVRALCVMHCFGHPADLDGLADVCQRFDLTLIEDAAESLGSFYKGVHTGRKARLSAVSFNGNKILTTGGGGAILTNDAELADRAKHLTTTAKVPHAFEFIHDSVGWNFRLPNINAALGVAQLRHMPTILAAKRRLAAAYSSALDGIDGVRFVMEPDDSRSNYWLNCLVLDPKVEGQRDQILQRLNEEGFQSRPLWRPMHQLPMFSDCPRDELPATESLYRRCINVPSSADLAPGWSGATP